jgi:hypothetical protein
MTLPLKLNGKISTKLAISNHNMTYIYFFITLFCVLGVVLQTILDVYNCFTCIVSLYRNDPTPVMVRLIVDWFFRRIYIYKSYCDYLLLVLLIFFHSVSKVTNLTITGVGSLRYNDTIQVKQL